MREGEQRRVIERLASDELEGNAHVRLVGPGDDALDRVVKLADQRWRQPAPSNHEAVALKYFHG